MDALLQDLRYAFRALGRSPAFTSVALLTLALGIGANTAIFSAIHAVLLRPLPYAGPDRIVRAFEQSDGNVSTWSPPNFVDMREQATVFEQVAAYHGSSYALTGEGPAEQLQGLNTTVGLFEVLGVRPAIGRGFTAADGVVGANPVVVLGHRLWERRFGGDPDVVGRRIALDGQNYEVVGVMPDGFRYPETAELWTPLAFTERDLTTQRGAHYLDVVGRLRQEANPEGAEVELETIMARLASEYPSTNEGIGAVVEGLHASMVGDVRPALLILLVAVGLVLLIACVNVANLTLARAVDRERELTIRTALGAGRRRLLRQLLTESIVLALAGGAVGILVAAWGENVLASMQPGDIPRLDQTGIDRTVLGFALGLSLLTGLLFGLVPAIRASSRVELSSSLKEHGPDGTGAPGAWRIRAGLIASQMALAVVLLIGAGLLARSFTRLQSVDPGFEPAGVFTFNVSLPDAGYDSPERVADYYRDLLERIGALPGVERVGAVFGLPMTGFSYTISVEELDGAPTSEREIYTQVRIATPDYLAAMGIPLIQGRGLTARDRFGAPPVVVVNETAARTLWPDGDPIGRSVEIGTGMGLDRGRLRGEVVGVVRDVKHRGLESTAIAETYFAHDQFPEDFMSVAVRTTGDLDALVAPIRAAVHALDPNVPMYGEQPMTLRVADSVARARFYMALLAVFGGIALVLAVVGIYGVMAHVVGQRRRQIGIRIALGAPQGEVLWMVIRQAMLVALTGLAAGLVASLGLSRALTRTGLLFELSPADPLTYGLVGLALAATALAATFVPARRASRIDPIEALRYE